MQDLYALVIFKRQTSRSPIYKQVTFNTVHNSTTPKERQMLSFVQLKATTDYDYIDARKRVIS